MAFIYYLTADSKGGIFYIGRTGDINIRMREHARKKFKGVSFIHVIIEECNDDDERKREYYWMKKLKAQGHPLINKETFGKYAKTNKFNPLK